MTGIEVLFWLTLLVVFWAYLGYFMLLGLLSLLSGKKIHRQDWFPPVSLIITAYNEEKRILQKLENTLALVYPKDKLEIIVVSDGSTDRTEEIVRSFCSHGVKLLPLPERHGKHYGQGRGIKMAASDIVVLSDATTFLMPDAVTKIVRSFADPTIGCVSGEDKPADHRSETAGEGAYVRYEMKLRALESRVGSLVGASGCFFSVRKSLCDFWIDDMSSDFYMPIVAHTRGLRAIADHDAHAYYNVLDNPAREFDRKVRTILHGLEVLFRFKAVLNPFKYGFYSVQLISHKLCRWLVPYALLLALALNLALVSHGWGYGWLLAGQGLLYLLALAAWLSPGLQKKAPFRIPLFFVMVNLSILVAWYQYWTGKKQVVWDATKR